MGKGSEDTDSRVVKTMANDIQSGQGRKERAMQAVIWKTSRTVKRLDILKRLEVEKSARNWVKSYKDRKL